MIEEDKILFDAADVDGDGKLNSVEFLSFSHPEEDPKMVAPGKQSYDRESQRSVVCKFLECNK
jgi:hypothetical protein